MSPYNFKKRSSFNVKKNIFLKLFWGLLKRNLTIFPDRPTILLIYLLSPLHKHTHQHTHTRSTKIMRRTCLLHF